MKLIELLKEYLVKGQRVLPNIVSMIMSALGPWPQNADKKREVLQAFDEDEDEIRTIKCNISNKQRILKIFKRFTHYNENDFTDTPEQVRILLIDLREIFLDDYPEPTILDSINMLILYCSSQIHQRNMLSPDHSFNFRERPKNVVWKMQSFFHVTINDDNCSSASFNNHFIRAKSWIAKKVKALESDLARIHKLQIQQLGDELRKRQELKTTLKILLLMNPEQSDDAWFNAVFNVPTVRHYTCHAKPALETDDTREALDDNEFVTPYGFSTPIGHSAIFTDKRFPCLDALSGLVNSHAMCSYLTDGLYIRDIGGLRHTSMRFCRNASLTMESMQCDARTFQQSLGEMLNELCCNAETSYAGLREHLSIAVCKKFQSSNSTVTVVSAVKDAALLAYFPESNNTYMLH